MATSFSRSGGRVSSTLSSSLWRGRVEEVLADGSVWVLIPRLTGEAPIGPIMTLVPGLEPGASVIIGAIENSTSDLIVLAAG